LKTLHHSDVKIGNARRVDSFGLARRLRAPIWVYDIDACAIVYANKPACELWGAPDEASLKKRDLSVGMSVTVAERLQQYQVEFLVRDAEFSEVWTLFPNDTPVTVNVIYSGFQLESGRMAMMVEVLGETEQPTETLRSTKALLHTDVSIALFTLDGLPLYKNPAAQKVLINSSATLEQLFEDTKDFLSLKTECEENGASRIITKLKTKHRVRWFDVAAKGCRDTKTGEKALLITASDVNELKAAEMAVLQAKEIAESANRAKSEFLANMSHEIRTPMNGVLGMLDVLEQTELNETQKGCTDIIRKSGNNLLETINDILDCSRLEAGETKINPVRCNLKKIITECLGIYRPRAQDKNLSIDFNYAPEVPEFFIADLDHIQQILSNIISNAIKFTPEGSISIDVFGATDVDTTDVKIVIKDTGIGIAADKIDSIFDTFTQAESSTTRSYGGTGLGLAISRGLAEAMSGELTVKSTLGDGASFTLFLSLKNAENELVGQTSALVTQTEKKPVMPRTPAVDRPEASLNVRLNLLIVEDDEVTRIAVSSLLKHPHVNMTFAKNGEDAIKVFKVKKFDIIFMDVSMPVMDGMTATRFIRKLEEDYALGRTPIIGLTAHSGVGDIQNILKSGMDDCVSKPVQRATLLKAISKWIKLSRSASGNGRAHPSKYL
jgi:signal transduction histidine kinase/ActR/RegA family two-component response regulator